MFNPNQNPMKGLSRALLLILLVGFVFSNSLIAQGVSPPDVITTIDNQNILINHLPGNPDDNSDLLIDSARDPIPIVNHGVVIYTEFGTISNLTIRHEDPGRTPVYTNEFIYSVSFTGSSAIFEQPYLAMQYPKRE